MSTSKFSDCPDCGKVTRSGDNFCRYCGFQINSVSRPGRLQRIFYGMAVLATAGITAAVIIYALTSPIALHSAEPTTSKVGRVQSSVAAPPSSTSSAPVTSSLSASGQNNAWTTETENYRGVTFNLRLPSLLSHLHTSSPTEWVWQSLHGTYYAMLKISSKPSANATQPLGAHVLGSPISAEGNALTQTINVQWARHRWLNLVMVVPQADMSWLGAIAQSLQIS